MIRALVMLALGLTVTTLSLLLIMPWDLPLAQSLSHPWLGPLIHDWGRTPATALIIGAAYVLAMRLPGVDGMGLGEAVGLGQGGRKRRAGGTSTTSNAGIGRQARSALSSSAGRCTGKPREPLLDRLASATLMHLVLHAAVITNGLKLLTGRPRPHALTDDAANFQPWHTLNPRLGDLSFPSGHVAVTLILVPAILILWRSHRRWSLALAACTTAWALISAYGRMVHHAHFLTDVTASIGLGLALAPLSVHLSDRLMRWRADRTQKRASPAKKCPTAAQDASSRVSPPDPLH